jgi:4-diphosphocytidyl-2-C-methyl-D-erythritol kinase
MLTLLSPAKVNLFLNIVGKRSDGYHAIATLIQAIDLCDLLTIASSHEDRLTCSDLSLPMDHTNLVYRALDLFRTRTGHQGKYTIHLDKRIPMQAGLGGGSGNAATVLWGVNRLSGLGVADAQLAQWGAEIGSDIPFFFSSGTAYCTGRGEVIRDLPCRGLEKLHLIKPPEGLATVAVYKALDLRKCSKQDPETSLDRYLNGSLELHNDLEEPAFRQMPSLLQLKQRLKQEGFEDVLMSGSGTALFCLGEGKSNLPTAYFQQTCVPIGRSADTWFRKTL